jgi:hypothetical protein
LLMLFVKAYFFRTDTESLSGVTVCERITTLSSLAKALETLLILVVIFGQMLVHFVKKKSATYILPSTSLLELFFRFDS